MKSNNSYLKHQLKILSLHEGVTVEAREKAFAYVAKKMQEMGETILKLEGNLQNARDEIQTMTNEMELMKKEPDASKEKKPAKKTKKA